MYWCTGSAVMPRHCTLATIASAEAFRQDLLRIARTTLSSKILSQEKEHFAELAVNAVLRLKVSPVPTY